MGSFARPEHPLALFLDDLQWLDAATLDLLEDLLTQLGPAATCCWWAPIATTKSPPRIRSRASCTRSAARGAGSMTSSWRRSPARISRAVALGSASWRAGNRAAPLAQLVHGGDRLAIRFFVIRFLYALVEEDLLAPDPHAAMALGSQRASTPRATPTTSWTCWSASWPSCRRRNAAGACAQLSCLGSIAEITTLGGRSSMAPEEQVHARCGEAVR